MSAPAPDQPDLANDRSPLAEVWSIAWPTVLTMTSYTVMQFVDGLMVGRIGALEVAAQGNGMIWAFTPVAFAMGIATVVNTYVSQNLGAGRPERGAQYGWAAIWFAVAIWLLVLVPYASVIGALFEHVVHISQFNRIDELLASSDPDEVARGVRDAKDLAAILPMETAYSRILLFGGVFQLAGRGIHHYFFGMHRPRIVTLAALVGNVTNVLANYVLIFGSRGLPELGLPGVPGVPALGVVGAALGTVMGTAVEFGLPFFIFIGPKMNAAFHTRAAWRPRWKPIRDILKIGWPAAVQFGNEITCWAVFMSTLVGTFGTLHQTAGWIALRYMHLSFMPAVGFSVAVTSLVGKYIGAGDPDTAAKRARLGLLLGTSYMTVCAVLFVVFRFDLVRFYISAQQNAVADQAIVIEIGAKLLICAAIFQTFDALGIIYSGALRGAGDTVWPGVITIFYSWTFIVGGGWVFVQYMPQLESVGPWIGAGAYIIVLGVTMAWRFEAGRWRSISLLDHDDDDRRPPRRPAGQPLTTPEAADAVPAISAAATPDEPAPPPNA